MDDFDDEIQRDAYCAEVDATGRIEWIGAYDGTLEMGLLAAGIDRVLAKGFLDEGQSVTVGGTTFSTANATLITVWSR